MGIENKKLACCPRRLTTFNEIKQNDMNRNIFFALITGILIMRGIAAGAQTQVEPWNTAQLISTGRLSDILKSDSASSPLVISVGPSAVIKGSVDAGAAHEKQHLAQLKKILSGESKSREVIIYCGCCPFDRCPNIRPAFSLLKQMGFSNAKLLDVPKNIKADWIDKGYPINEE